MGTLDLFKQMTEQMKRYNDVEEKKNEYLYLIVGSLAELYENLRVQRTEIGRSP